MGIKTFILKQLKEKDFITATRIAKSQKVSRAFVNKMLQELRQSGEIILIGKTNNAKYVLKEKAKKIQGDNLLFNRVLVNKNLLEDVILQEAKDETGIFFNLKENVAKIVDYGFTEMLNNAIEHSRAKKISVNCVRGEEGIFFVIKDNGIGIFNDIKKKFNLPDIFAAVDLLLKGKHTSLPQSHSGEGVFFTSKVADKFAIKSFNKILSFDNKIDDVSVKDAKILLKGTRVSFFIELESNKELSDIFNRYSNENFVFDKTDVRVKILELASADYVSRSQAKRLVFGLDKFESVILDFKNVSAIGQGFADEVFRVWQKSHSDIKIEFKNANPNVEFMIKRALAME